MSSARGAALPARLELKSRLLADANACLGTAAGWLEERGQRHLSQSRQCRRLLGFELATLQSRDAGDERQGVVKPPLMFTVARPGAHIAIIDGLRIVGGRDSCVAESNGCLPLCANQSEIRGVVVDPIGIYGCIRVRREPVKMLRLLSRGQCRASPSRD